VINAGEFVDGYVPDSQFGSLPMDRLDAAIHWFV
jgi:hypothetical protein